MLSELLYEQIAYLAFLFFFYRQKNIIMQIAYFVFLSNYPLHDPVGYVQYAVCELQTHNVDCCSLELFWKLLWFTLTKRKHWLASIYNYNIEHGKSLSIITPEIAEEMTQQRK